MNLLIAGAGGMLGQALARTAGERGHDVVAAPRSALDVTDEIAVERMLARVRPDAVIDCAAYTRVDDAETDPQAAFAVNAAGAATLGRATAALGARFVYPSTDYVFDGTATRPYSPTDATAPLNVYGQSKLAGEQSARECPGHLVVRTSWLYGAGGKNFVATMLQRARAGDSLRVVGDQHGCPTWTRDLARTMLLLLERAAPDGTYHACNEGETTWYDFACAALQLAALSVPVQRVTSSEFVRPARRPAYAVLECSSTVAITGPLRSWRAALADAIAEGVA